MLNKNLSTYLKHLQNWDIFGSMSAKEVTVKTMSKISKASICDITEGTSWSLSCMIIWYLMQENCHKKIIQCFKTQLTKSI